MDYARRTEPAESLRDGPGYLAAVLGTRALLRVAITFLAHMLYDIWLPGASFLYALLVYDFVYHIGHAIIDKSLFEGFGAFICMALVLWAGTVNSDLATGMEWALHKVGVVLRPELPELVYWNERHTFLVWGMVWATMFLIAARAAGQYYLRGWWASNQVAGGGRSGRRNPAIRFFLRVIE